MKERPTAAATEEAIRAALRTAREQMDRHLSTDAQLAALWAEAAQALHVALARLTEAERGTI